jgi:hypothetical protein
MLLEVRRRVLAMWEAAQQIAAREDMPLDDSKGLLLTLFRGRVPLVTNDDNLKRGKSARRASPCTVLRQRGLFNPRHLFPLTD